MTTSSIVDFRHNVKSIRKNISPPAIHPYLLFAFYQTFRYNTPHEASKFRGAGLFDNKRRKHKTSTILEFPCLRFAVHQQISFFVFLPIFVVKIIIQKIPPSWVLTTIPPGLRPPCHSERTWGICWFRKNSTPASRSDFWKTHARPHHLHSYMPTDVNIFIIEIRRSSANLFLRVSSYLRVKNNNSENSSFLSPWVLVFLSSYSFLFDIYQTFCYNTPEARRLPEQGYLTTEEENTSDALLNSPASRVVLPFTLSLFTFPLYSISF